MEERIQKIMAQAGLGSRRDCEEYIIAGRVRVNGLVAVIGQKADPKSDTITVDNRAIKAAEEKIYIALHKPKYVLSTVDAEQGDSRQTVRNLIPVSERLYPVGRLDFESEGLVLMTNDGELAQKLTHPSHGHSKEYRVLLARQPDTEQIATWQRGVVLEDGYKTQKAEVRTESLAGKGAWLRIIMREGRKRQIREIGAILALPVVRIVRIRIGNLLLGDLKPAEWRYLTPAEIKALKEDRPGLAPFPDMTRKNYGKYKNKPFDKSADRKRPSDSPAKPAGRTRPPGWIEKTSDRREIPDNNQRSSDRRENPARKPRPADSREKSESRPKPSEHRENLERKPRPADSRENPVRKSKSSEHRENPARKPRPVDSREQSESRPKSSEHRENPERKPKPSGHRENPRNSPKPYRRKP